MKQRYLHWTMLLAVLILLLIVAALWSLTTGEIHISLGHLADVLSQSDSLEKAILTQIRIPRLVLAFSIGGTLSLVGAILQGVFRNPLVEPYTLGISGGASLGVAIVIVLGTGLMGHLLTLPIAGFAGSLVTILLVYFLGMRRGTGNVNRMLLIGVMLTNLGFESEKNTFVKQLPLGWKQKLSFAVAIFHEPEIVFLDEPTGGVDPVSRRQFWEMIYQAAERGITVFVTTHYMEKDWTAIR